MYHSKAVVVVFPTVEGIVIILLDHFELWQSIYNKNKKIQDITRNLPIDNGMELCEDWIEQEL